LIGGERAAILMLDSDGQALIERALRAGRDAGIANTQVNDPMAWRAVRSNQSVAGQPRVDPADETRKVDLYAPMVIGKTCIGVLTVTALAETVSEHQLFLLSSLADYAAVGLEQARMIAEL